LDLCARLRQATPGSPTQGASGQAAPTQPIVAAGNLRAMATTGENRTIAPIVGPDDPRRFNDSGIEVQPLYTEVDLPEGLSRQLGEPGEYPYTRGVHRDMYRKQLWTMRQYAGYASAKESNQRYRYLLEHGSTGLSMAFDLPTQLGLDSDDPRCLGEVGRTGVAIDTIDDMRTAFDEIPLDKVSTSMTINAPASVLLLLYELVGEEQGVAADQLRGTTQNDILKEYIARGNFIYPPEGAIRLTTDLFAYCNERIPKWNTISISGYHFREKGCSAVQEIAFTLANGITYVQAALDAGLEIDRFAPRLAFFFNGHNNVFQEVAKFRAARKMWAEIMRERFGAQDERSWRLRFHTQTGGVTLTAQQPENNIVRVALQGFAAVCGGTQSLHTNGFDEALALPTERAAKIALRTQQIIGNESGAADTVDPFAGSYFIEALTDEIETRAKELIAKVDELGGSVQAINFMKAEIEESAFGYHERYRIGQDIVVGVNQFVEDSPEVPDILRVDPESERAQLDRLKAFKSSRDQELVERHLEQIRVTARGSDNLLPVLREALKDRCSMGEVCAAMRDVFGEYHPTF
jgi:methylmalonyl-CoA mutase N-terminal domain/subunit